MSKTYSFFKVLFSALLVISIIFANVSVALADDGTPPADETPTTEPTNQEGTTETSIPEEPPMPTTEVAVTPTLESTPSPEETPTINSTEETTPTAESTPQIEETASVEDDTVLAEDDAPEVALFEQVPDGTDVVVLDENGNSLPLATEEALDTILDTDPMWCPAGILPGGPGCSANYSTISALLSNMRSNTGNYTQDGIIYFTANTGGSFSLTTSGSSLGNSDFNTLNDYDLTLQGGWNGLNGASATFTGQTNFGSSTLTIGTSSNPWVGNITINDFKFNNVTSGNAISVHTTSGDITLDNVTVTEQRGDDYTADLDSQSGDVTIQNSTFDGDNGGGSSNRNRGFNAETNSGSITISNTTFKDTSNCASFFIFCSDESSNYNGATLSASTVTLTNVTAYNNDLSGIEINNANSIWLNNVVAYNNGTSILFGLLGVGSGVNVNGTGPTVVNVNGGSLTNNEAYGLSVFNGSISAVSDPTCSGNRYPGPHPSTCYNIMPTDITPPVLSLPADITTEATGPSGAVVTFAPTANDAVDGSVLVSCAPASGSTLSIGTTTVNCSASDTSGNTANGSFNVTVQDTTAPVLTLPANITSEATGPSGATVTYSVFASDLVDGSVSVTCVPASGGTFSIGTTTVNCSATDSNSNTANGSFNVTVQDTTAPVISPHADIVTETDLKAGAIVLFSPPATSDVADGAGLASCAPASGSLFVEGVTTVTCTAIDTNGNVAVPVTFTVTINYVPKVTPTIFGGLFITVTGGELIDLDCLTAVNAFGIKVTFHNLCDHQSIITDMDANTLPADLPTGVTFVDALNIVVLSDGKLVNELPLGTGVQVDFTIKADAQVENTVLLWDNENKEWLDVTQLMKDEELSKVLSTDSEDELYQIAPTAITKAFYRILSTEKTGTFVIVKK